MAYAQFGTSYYKYGSSDRLYGVPGTTPTTKLWTINIDWDNDGLYSGDNEALYCTGLETDRGFTDVYAINGEGYYDHFAPPQVGTCTLTLSNHTGRYNLWNADGSPSTSIRPGVLASVLVRDGYTSTDSPVFAGIVKSISVDEVADNVTLTLHDGVEVLQDREVHIAKLDSPSNATVLETILSEIDWRWSYSESVLDSTPQYFLANERASRILHDFAKTGPNVFFTDGSGNLRLEPVTAEGYTSSDPDMVTHTVDATTLLKDIKMSLPWENLATRYQIASYVYQAQASGVIWSQGDNTYQIAAESTQTLLIDYSYSNNQNPDLFFAVPTTPASSTDWVVNTSPDGLGSNITSSVTVTLTDYSRRGLLTIVNSSTDAGYFTTFQVRGTPYIAYKSTEQVDLTDWLGVGTRLFTVDTPYNNGTNSKAQIAYTYLGYPHNQRQLQVQIQTRPVQFAKEINDLILLDGAIPTQYKIKSWGTGGLTEYYYNQFRIMRIRHKWLSTNGQDILTIWNLRHAAQTQEPNIF